MAGNLTAMIAAAFSGGAAPPVTTDPYFDYTTLLLPGNGTNGAQNNTFLDGSTNNFTITRNGNTTQGTFSPFSQTGWGNYFDGTGDYLTVASNTALTYGTGNFTIEGWHYLTASASSTKYLFDQRVSGNGFFPALYISSGQYVVYINGAIPIQAGTVAANSWVHWALVKNASTTSLYINGTSVGSFTDNNNYSTTAQFRIGSEYTASGLYDWSGYISNVRVVKGTAVYTANFTPPTTPLTAISGTSLLTCQSNRFKDSSSNAFTITSSGGPTVVAFSPFNPSASWSAATNGGSGYFDGSGDYLTAASNSAFAFGLGDFTVECWVYVTALNRQHSLFDARSTNTNGWVFFINSSNQVGFYDGSTASNSTDTVSANSWNHIAYARSGSSLKAFLNGKEVLSVSSSRNNSSNVPAYVGVSYDSVNPTLGYISNTRIVKGTAVYTAAFTPPTAPFTATQSANTNGNPSAAITGTATSLLLNFTNAGIYDATSKNDLETVGNAQISTSVSKFGGGSIAFDGTGDYLTLPSSNLLAFGSGDFTLEFWIYPTSAAATNALIMWTTSGDYIALAMNTSRNVVLDRYGTATLATTSNTLTLNTWNHVAVARSGITLQIYINGTSGASITNSTNWQASTIQIGNNGFTSYLFGYLEYLRFTKGYARYTANFTPPTAAFPTL